MHAIAVLPGDGIGGEVVDAACRVLDRVADRFGFRLAWTSYDWGCEHYRRTGRMMPEDALDLLAAHQAVLLGAVGAPEVPDHVSLWGMLIPIRRGFDQYVNLRPVRLLRGVRSPLRDAAGVDFVIVRENTEGEYSEIGGRQGRGRPGELAVQESVFTRTGVERVVEYAFRLAAGRRGEVLSATKSNGIVHTMPFWDEVFWEIAARHPQVRAAQMHVDALAAYLVLHPERVDVIVASNLFGDILSDLGAAVVGSIGIAPSANLDPERRHPSLFEPVHGSAPDIVGTGRANPAGAIWSGALMLDHLGYSEAAAAVVGALESALGDAGVSTPDLGGTATTDEVTDAVLRALDSSAEGSG